ncbi:MAG TPA: ABC transporter permease subunit [Bacteroidota bacterium]|nr:ABC transporter permease subunit [Bacteroidota bacterium]
MWTIVKRELLDHLVTLRFSALFALTFLLMTMTVLVFSGDYARRMREYPRRVEGFVDDDGRVHLGWIACQGVGVRAVPSPLAFLSAAGDRVLPNRVSLALHAVSTIERAAGPGDAIGGDNGTDWTFIISALLSFGAGLLTYKSISGERRDGTLTLVMAHPLSRATLLAAKYLAAMIALGAVLTISMLAGAILLRALGTVPMSADDWWKLIMFGALALVFLSFFVLTGLACSVWTRSPVLSAVAFLFTWMTLVFVVPNLGGILAGLTGTVPSPLSIREAARTIPDRYTLTPSMSAVDADRVKLDRESARERMVLDYLGALTRQVDLGRDLTRVSPASAFAYAAERIAGSGTLRLDRFVRNAVEYRRGFLEAVIAADRTDPQSEHRYVPWWCGGNHFSQRTVDPGPQKEFHDTLPTGSEGVAAAGWDIAALLLENLIAFALAFWRFARQDVAPVPGT